LDDKDAVGIMTTLFDHLGDEIDHLTVNQSNSPRAIPAKELDEIALDDGWDEVNILNNRSDKDAISWAVQGVRDVDDQVQDAGRTLTAGTGGSGVLVTGSITLVGQVRELLGAETANTDASVEISGHDDFSEFFPEDPQEDDDES